jgi:N-acetylmuramoyl-L-alanine amidase CwlA
MLLRRGSKGEDVKTLQKILGLTADGIFGAQTEAAVKNWQKVHGLTADGIVGDKTWVAMTGTAQTQASSKAIGPGVVYSPISVHMGSCPGGRKIEYLVIHYTAGSTSKEGAAEQSRRVFLSRNASADFVVDDKTMLQVNPDPLKFYCWAVGDGNGKYGVTNKNAISIEICSNLTKGTTAKVPNHDGWFFTDASINNAVELAKMIMRKYNIPLERVIRHYDASRKLCPGILGWNPGTVYDAVTGKPTKDKSTEEKWHAFKNRLQ